MVYVTLVAQIGNTEMLPWFLAKLFEPIWASGATGFQLLAIYLQAICGDFTVP